MAALHLLPSNSQPATAAQTLLVLVKRMPPVGKKLLVIGTSSTGEIMESMGLGGGSRVTLCAELPMGGVELTSEHWHSRLGA